MQGARTCHDPQVSVGLPGEPTWLNTLSESGPPGARVGGDLPKLNEGGTGIVAECGLRLSAVLSVVDWRPPPEVSEHQESAEIDPTGATLVGAVDEYSERRPPPAVLKDVVAGPIEMLHPTNSGIGGRLSVGRHGR